jgi:hypothetical protein
VGVNVCTLVVRISELVHVVATRSAMAVDGHRKLTTVVGVDAGAASRELVDVGASYMAGEMNRRRVD